MAKEFKSSGVPRGPKKPAKVKLSLYPLDLETALGAALLTGVASRDKAKNSRFKSVEKPKRNPRKNDPQRD